LIWATEITIEAGMMQEVVDIAWTTADGSEIVDLEEILPGRLSMDLVSGHVNMLRSQLETYSQDSKLIGVLGKELNLLIHSKSLIWATEITTEAGTMLEAEEYAMTTADGSETVELEEIPQEKLSMGLASGHVNMPRNQSTIDKEKSF
jgi:hypothetical protein